MENDRYTKLTKIRKKKSRDLDQVRCIEDEERKKIWLQIKILERDGRTILISFSMMDKYLPVI